MAEAIIFGGAQAVNPEAICATSGQVCPARAEVIRAYSEHCPPELSDGLPKECQSRLDDAKLMVRLSEYTVIAKTIGCEGAQNGACPARELMDRSKVRRGVVSSLRKILRRELA